MDPHVDTSARRMGWAYYKTNTRRKDVRPRAAFQLDNGAGRKHTSSNKSVIVAVTNGAPAMADEIDKQFASHREMFPTEEDKKAFDQLVKQLLEKHGVDYVRGYVDALKDMQKRKAS